MAVNIESLEYFVRIAEAGSITKAAKDRFISAQGLNKMLTGMEDELGYRLVERTKRGVTLTDSGEVFLKHARKLLKGYGDMLEELAVSDCDHALMMECPYRIAATALCLERVVQPLVSLGLMGDATLREVTLDSALERSADEGWLSLVDIPTYADTRIGPLKDSSLFKIATARMGAVYSKKSFPNLPANPSVADISHLPLGIIDAPTMHEYADCIFAPDVLAAQTRYITRQYNILANAAQSGRAAVLFDSLSLSQSDTWRALDVSFAPIEDHTCEIGFIHYADASDPNKRAYIDTFRRTFQSAAKKNGWEIS